MPDNLVVTGIEFDSRLMVRAIEQAEQRINRLENEVDQAGRAAKKSEGDFLKFAAGVAVAFGAFTAARRAAGFIFETNKEFQQLEARLESITGSVQGAETAFQLITDFAIETPFEVANLTEAFTLLQAVGIEPTADMLRDLGNFAAAFGADIMEFTNAVIRAGAGEAEALKRFGVVARVEGEQLEVTFRGVTQTVDREFGAVVDLFRQISAENFGTAMAVQMETIVGSISNLQDAAALAAKEVGEQGLNQAINDLAKELTEALKVNEDFARSLGQNLADGVRISGAALQALIEHMDAIVLAMQVLTGAAIGSGLARLTRGIWGAATAAGGLSAALAANPVGIILTLAGAIGGPLLAGLISSRGEAEALNQALSDAAKSFDTMSAAEMDASIAKAETELARLRSNDVAFNLFPAGHPNRAQHELEKDLQEALLADLQRRRAALAPASSDSTAGVEQASKDFDKLTQSLQEQLVTLRDGERAAFAYALSLEDLTDKQRAALLEQFDAIQAQRDDNDAKKKATEEAQKNAEAVANTIERLSEQNMELLMGEDALLRYTLASKGATEADIQRAIGLAQANRELAEAQRKAEQDAAQVAREAQARLEAQAQQLQNAADRMAGAVSDAFIEWVSGAEKAEEAFRNLVDGVIRETARLVTQRTITEPLAQFIVGLLGGVGGGSGAGQIVGDAVFGGFAASGGPVSGGTSYIVGEQGPELFTPGSSGFITPNHAMGGNVVNQTVQFNISALDAPGVSELLMGQKATLALIVREAAQESTGFRMSLLGR